MPPVDGNAESLLSTIEAEPVRVAASLPAPSVSQETVEFVSLIEYPFGASISLNSYVLLSSRPFTTILPLLSVTIKPLAFAVARDEVQPVTE